MIMENKLKRLVEKGVKITSLSNVEIGDDVNLDRISGDGVTLFGGCRIYGKNTWISKGCTIGKEGPVTLDNCWLGPDVKIQGGYVSSSVLLNRTSVGSGAHIREGCILEEESSIAHTVGLKQTILLPFVTLGSLINFCDCFMAGGTSRKNHSEVGSSYIHFNYTPNQDKATASLIGDVAHGVMLNNRPIFLGGQGGLVGPCRLNFGTVIAAGTIQRKDETEPDRLLFGGALRPGNIKHTPGQFQNIPRVVKNNILYIGNLVALMNWYRHVRSRFISDSFPAPLLEGLIKTLNLGINERIKRLKDFLDKVTVAKNTYETMVLTRNWDKLRKELEQHLSPDTISCEEKYLYFSNLLERDLRNSGIDHYTEAIQRLSRETSEAGTAWLSAVVDDIFEKTSYQIPGMKS